jgi:uncharacterized protein (TIGR00251 family)
MPCPAAATTLRFRVHLQPRSARTRIVGRHGEALKIQVQAPPVGGAANDALVNLLAKVLGVPRRAVRIAHGSSSRSKVVEVQAKSPDACVQRLHEAADRTR